MPYMLRVSFTCDTVALNTLFIAILRHVPSTASTAKDMENLSVTRMKPDSWNIIVYLAQVVVRYHATYTKTAQDTLLSH